MKMSLRKANIALRILLKVWLKQMWLKTVFESIVQQCLSTYSATLRLPKCYYKESLNFT